MEREGDGVGRGTEKGREGYGKECGEGEEETALTPRSEKFYIIFDTLGGGEEGGYHLTVGIRMSYS